MEQFQKAKTTITHFIDQCVPDLKEDTLTKIKEIEDEKLGPSTGSEHALQSRWEPQEEALSEQIANATDVTESTAAGSAMMAGHAHIVLSYRTESSTSPNGGEKLMLRIAKTLKESGYVTFNGLQVPAGGNWREWWCRKV